MDNKSSQGKLYWEEQESGFCAVHALNNMLQGAYFTEVDLSQIALELDRKEKQLMAAQGLDNPEFLRFVANDSTNVNLGGNFSIDVIRQALQVMGLVCLRRSSEDAKASMNNPCGEKAYLLHLQDHWFAVRKLNGQWFNLNSLEKGPTHISDFYLRHVDDVQS